MTKPGRHPWAKDDVWTAGLDVGADTKAAPPQANVDEGYYRRRRPGPDVFNWQLHRNALIHETVARLQAMNFQFIVSNPIDYQSGYLTASCHYGDAAKQTVFCSTFSINNVTNVLHEFASSHGVAWATPAADPVFAVMAGLPAKIDADGSDGDHRIVVHNAAADQLRYNTGGAWANTSITGTAPAYLWQSVGCDRDTAGGAAAHWLVGAWTSAIAPAEIWSSANGIAFAKEVGFTTANNANVDGIYHSNHPAGALGPDDLGNPSWLALSDDNVYRSTNHVAWSGPVALGVDARNNRSAAYSRPSRRWVVAHSDLDFGDISYSDDNGATWTYLAGALPIDASFPVAGMEAHIAGDGYGTFVITRQLRRVGANPVDAAKIWVSVDEGLTWSLTEIMDDELAAWSYDDGAILEPCFQVDNDVNGTPQSGGFFIFAGYKDTLPTQTRIFRSLIV